jgi:hypothetical protein
MALGQAIDEMKVVDMKEMCELQRATKLIHEGRRRMRAVSQQTVVI